MVLAEVCDVRIGKGVVPNFKSYAVRLEYDVKVTLNVECAGQAEDVTVAWKYLKILPEE
jgi:hypothetical protein